MQGTCRPQGSILYGTCSSISKDSDRALEKYSAFCRMIAAAKIRQVRDFDEG